MATLVNENERLSRQANLLHDSLRTSVVVAAGVGMLGGWTVQALSRCVGKVHIWDGDTVEGVNTGTQPYNGLQIGQAKVEALAGALYGLPVEPIHALFDGSNLTKDRLLTEAGLPASPDRKLIVVSGVDSFVPRRQLAEWAQAQGADIFVDTRAQGHQAVVFMVPHDQLDRYLSEEIIDDADAPDLPCGFNGTAGVGMYVASQVFSYLNAYFFGLPVPFVQVTNLPTMEFMRREMLTPTAAGREDAAEAQ